MSAVCAITIVSEASKGCSACSFFVFEADSAIVVRPVFCAIQAPMRVLKMSVVMSIAAMARAVAVAVTRAILAAVPDPNRSEF